LKLTIYYIKCHYSYVFLVAYTNIWVTLKPLDGHTIRGILKNRHLSNATGRIRDESLINLGGRGLIRNKLAIQVANKINHDSCSLLRLCAKVNINVKTDITDNKGQQSLI
jgi:hypothetical protein